MMLFLSCIQTICLTTLSGITALLPLVPFSGADLGPALQMYWLNVLMTYGSKINIQVFLVQRTDACVWSVLRKTKTCQQMWSLHLLSPEMFMKSFYQFCHTIVTLITARKCHTAWWILNHFPPIISKIYIELKKIHNESIFIFHKHLIYVI